MARADEERPEPPRDFSDFFHPPWWLSSIVGPPQLDSVDPLGGDAGSEVTIKGQNLDGASVLFGSISAVILQAATDSLVVEVPANLSGDVLITVENFFGSATAPQPFHAPAAPRGFTFSGDAISYGGDLHSSIKSIGLNQPYLVLMVLPTDRSLPAGQTAASLRLNLISKLGPRPPQPPFPLNTANGFWWEATYQKTSFDFDVHTGVVGLPGTMASYFQTPRPRRIQGSGATFPVSFPAARTLVLQGDGGFTATATFPQGATTLAGAVTLINNAIDAAYAGPGPPPLRASSTAGQLTIDTTRAAANAVLVLSGTAVAGLGLAVPPAVLTPGLDAVINSTGAMVDALKGRVAGMAYAAAKALISSYAGVIVAFAGPTTLLRARATLGARRFDVPLPGAPAGQPADQFSLSGVWITTSDTFEVYAHEIGHNLGLPDLYQEPGAPTAAGVELDRWDIMADSTAARHPTAWSKAYKSRDATGTTWMPPGDIEVMTPPPGTGTKTTRVLLAPLESPMPANRTIFQPAYTENLVHAVRLELEPNRSLYVENRQRSRYGPDPNFGTVDYSRNLPGPVTTTSPSRAGVIVTDAVNNTTGLPVLRKEVVLLTPMTDPLDNPGEQQTVLIITPTNSIRVTLVEVVGFAPEVYLVELAWGQGSYFDFRIRDWSPPPWETPDIWVDTKVDNAWDAYRHSNPALNPGVPGNPILNGDRSRVGWESRVYARVWNDGDVPKTGVRVRFQIVVPAAMGPTPGTDIGDVTINLPAGGFALARVDWTPASAPQSHVCVRAMVDYDPGELNANNNMAQENITDWWTQGSPPYDPVDFPFLVTNPLPRPTQVVMKARGLLPGWFLDVDPAEFWLEPEETIEGKATIRADGRVPIEGGDIPPPVISLEALAAQGDTWVPFGGVSGTAHAVRRAKLEVDVSRGKESIDVSGRASTEVDVIRGANVSLRSLTERRREVELQQTTTDGAGEFSAALKPSRGRQTARYLEAILSPTLGTGPAEVELIDLGK